LISLSIQFGNFWIYPRTSRTWAHARFAYFKEGAMIRTLKFC